MKVFILNCKFLGLDTVLNCKCRMWQQGFLVRLFLCFLVKHSMKSAPECKCIDIAKFIDYISNSRLVPMLYRKTTEKYYFSVVSSISLFKRFCDDAPRNRLNQDPPAASRMSQVLEQVMLAVQLNIVHQKR